MKIFVTGGLGFVGVELTKRLLERHEVYVYDMNFFRTDISELRSACSGIRLEDIRDSDNLHKALRWFKPEVIVHLAALSNDPSAELDIKLTDQINRGGTINVAKAAVEAGVRRLIFSSSCSVYGIQSDEIHPATEDDPKNPISEYAKSKLLSEYDLKRDFGTEIELVILRPATIFGFSQRMRLDLYINYFSLKCIQDGVLSIDGGNQNRPNIYLDDMVAVYEFFVENGQPGTYNVANPDANLRIKDVAEIFQQLFSCGIQQSDRSDQRSYLVDSRRLLSSLPSQFTFSEFRRSITSTYRDISRHFGHVSQAFNDTKYYNVRALKAIVEQNLL